jgi:hypothetical protein
MNQELSGNGEGVVVGEGGHHFRGARRSFSNGNNHSCVKSSVSVARLVMPVHWIRDVHIIMLYFQRVIIGYRMYSIGYWLLSL